MHPDDHLNSPHALPFDMATTEPAFRPASRGFGVGHAGEPAVGAEKGNRPQPDPQGSTPAPFKNLRKG